MSSGACFPRLLVSQSQGKAVFQLCNGIHFPLFLVLAILPAMNQDSIISAQQLAPTKSGISYAEVDQKPQLLDLYLPQDQSDPAPLVIWVHGGAWRAGSRTRVPVTRLLEHGLAIASVDYRLSGQAAFPAQVHDINRAIDYLHLNADELGLDPARFAIAGSSAGGHLAALVGVSHGIAALSAPTPQALATNSKSPQLKAIVSFFGASNLQTILQQSTPHGLSVRVPALQLLLRGQPDQNPELAKLASPVTHVDSNDPPLLLLHGDQDPQMPINQSHELEGAYRRAGCPVHFDVVHGGGHGGKNFFTQAQLKRVAEFIKASFAD
ncbi:MAG TPA: lipase [Rhodopirellula sp.]|nr:lipase [Rhodopirellula sp.]